VRRNNLVFDVGLHRGEDTRFYLAKGFDVVAVEAMPDLARRAAEELRDYVESGQLVIENVAIAEEAGPVSFYVNPASEWGTIRADWARRNERLGSPSTGSFTVTALRFGGLLERHGAPHYLKIDIEGADLLCLETLDPAESPTFVSIESDKISWAGWCTSWTCWSDSVAVDSRWSGSTGCHGKRRPTRRGRATTSRGASASAPAVCSGRRPWTLAWPP